MIWRTGKEKEILRQPRRDLRAAFVLSVNLVFITVESDRLIKCVGKRDFRHIYRRYIANVSELFEADTLLGGVH